MDNITICKRIAEIEGYHVSTDVKPSCGSAYANIYPNNCYGNYNPLTDKALCFDLIEQWVEEFGIDIHRAYKEHPCAYAVDTGFSVIFNDSLAKAACLARIEINKRGDRI
jgi:hypothetical protein